MITERDLDIIGPPPTRRRRSSGGGSPGEGWPASGDSLGVPESLSAPTAAVAAAPSIPSAEGPTPGLASVSTTAVIMLRGPCQRPLLDELRAQAATLLAAGVAELVVDLSAATAADPRLPRALSDLQRRVQRHHASLILTGASGALDAALETATLEQAFLIYRSPAPPPPAPTPDPSDPSPSATSTSDPSPLTTGASAP